MKRGSARHNMPKRSFGSPSKKVLRFTRTTVNPFSKGAADSGYYFSTSLANLVSSDILALFQEYRITNIKFTVRLPNALNNNADFPTLYYARYRQTPSAPPSQLSDVSQITGCRVYQFGPSKNSITFSCKPSTLAAALTSAGVGYHVEQDKWFSVESVNVQNISFAVWISRYNSTSSPTHSLEYEMTYTIECKGTR